MPSIASSSAGRKKFTRRCLPSASLSVALISRGAKSISAFAFFSKDFEAFSR